MSASGPGKVRVGFHLWLPNLLFPSIYVHTVEAFTELPDQEGGVRLTSWTVPGIRLEKGDVLGLGFQHRCRSAQTGDVCQASMRLMESCPGELGFPGWPYSLRCYFIILYPSEA